MIGRRRSWVAALTECRGCGPQVSDWLFRGRYCGIRSPAATVKSALHFSWEVNPGHARQRRFQSHHHANGPPLRQDSPPVHPPRRRQYCRDHLRVRVEVEDGEVRSIGSKSRLLQALTGKNGVNSVPTQGLNWRRGCPPNLCSLGFIGIRKPRKTARKYL